ncbi:MAG: aconitase family protein [Paracoccaceae bacterium]|nr:aconitase family protein [Paracoccaceae bacterium]
MPRNENKAISIVQKDIKGKVFKCCEGLSFWGGVDPHTGRIIDIHHPNHGSFISKKFLLMPTSRGSCSGSGVLLQLAQSELAPAALIFHETEEILTLGAIVADQLFDKQVAVLKVSKEIYNDLARADTAEIFRNKLMFGSKIINLTKLNIGTLNLSAEDQSILKGERGTAQQIAMETICKMARLQNAKELIGITKGHIDGCILAHDANLMFAEKMYQLGASISIPTTINAISVNRNNWESQGIDPDFGNKASRLADAYVKMGAHPTYTCAPYLLEDIPKEHEVIGWSESNAVIYANSVLGAKTQKHPDYFDLFVAMTGRAPKAGVYLDKERMPKYEINIDLPSKFDDSIWPMIGWLIGKFSPNKIPLVTGLEKTSLTADDLKALCAAFGTTSAAPMLFIDGHTPGDELSNIQQMDKFKITHEHLATLWKDFNTADIKVDLVAIGSPHASLSECRNFVKFFDGKSCSPNVKTIITVGRDVLSQVKEEGILEELKRAGIQVVSDICWCSITEPIFPYNTSVIMTNSGKYAHYAHGLTGRKTRFGSLEDCAKTAQSGLANSDLPYWLSN